MKTLSTALAALLLSACAAPPSYVRIGAEPPSVVDLREATKSVKLYDAVPAGAESISDISAARCHRATYESPPTEGIIRSDLLIAAFGKDLNGMSEVSVVKEPGIEYNCWYILVGKAKAFKVN